MNTAGLVVVCLFAGALFVVILAALATLIFLVLQLKKQVTTAVSGFTTATKAIDDSIAGARTSFAGIRQDVKASLTEHSNRTADVLAAHQKAFEDTVGKVNGAALEAACKRSIQAAAQIVDVATNLKQLLYAAEGGMEQPPVPLAPEEYAPSESIYATQSPTARADALANAAEVVEFQSNSVPV